MQHNIHSPHAVCRSTSTYMYVFVLVLYTVHCIAFDTICMVFLHKNWRYSYYRLLHTCPSIWRRCTNKFRSPKENTFLLLTNAFICFFSFIILKKVTSYVGLSIPVNTHIRTIMYIHTTYYIHKYSWLKHIDVGSR